MKTLKEYLEKQINEQLKQAVLSGKRKGEGPSLIKVRPVEIKGRILYQASSTEGTQIFHKNYEREEVLEFLEKEITENFTQLQGQGETLDGTVLVSKKGKITVKAKNHPVKEKVKIQAHNRVKRYILKEGIPVPFLIDLGVIFRWLCFYCILFKFGKFFVHIINLTNRHVTFFTCKLLFFLLCFRCFL